MTVKYVGNIQVYMLCSDREANEAIFTLNRLSCNTFFIATSSVESHILA